MIVDVLCLKRTGLNEDKIETEVKAVNICYLLLEVRSPSLSESITSTVAGCFCDPVMSFHEIP